MKIKLLVSLSGAVTHHAGDEIDVSDSEAYNLIKSGAAKPISKDGFNVLEARIEKTKSDDEAKQAQIIAIQKKEELTNEADTLLENMLAIIATLSANDVGYKDKFLESFHEKWLVVFPVDDGKTKQANTGDKPAQDKGVGNEAKTDSSASK